MYCRRLAESVLGTAHSKNNAITSRYKSRREIQSNFNGSNTFGTMKISSRQGLVGWLVLGLTAL